jgi:hypothetical protein
MWDGELGRRDNFDIYLPLWLARRNKAIFGALFVLGVTGILPGFWARFIPYKL